MASTMTSVGTNLDKENNTIDKIKLWKQKTLRKKLQSMHDTSDIIYINCAACIDIVCIFIAVTCLLSHWRSENKVGQTHNSVVKKRI